MKRLYAAISLLAFIIAVSAGNSVTVCRCADLVSESVRQIEYYARAGDCKSALALAERFSEDFDRTEKLLCAVIHDEKISELSFSAARLAPLIENNSDELFAEIESICKQTDMLKRAALPYWYNII